MTCENCVSFKVCHAVALAGKVVNAEVQCDYFIDKDLINRQKAEIERLNSPYEMQVEASKKLENSIKAEAVKEFAERLKAETVEVDVSYCYGKEHYTEAVAVIVIDNLVKEMEGENNAPNH